MARAKIHYYVETDSATESSPETDGYLYCGREYDNPKTTDIPGCANCLSCIRAMWRKGYTLKNWQFDLMREASQRSGNAITPDWGHGNGC